MLLYSKLGPRLGPSLALVAAGATAYQLSSQGAAPPARCERPMSSSQPPEPATAVSIMALRRWLEQRGADMSAIDIKASPTDEGRFGVFANTALRKKAARGWWGLLKSGLGLGRNANVTLASFPLGSALTASSVLRQGGQQVELLRELAELGVVDERTLVMLHLAVERLRGADSKLCPWLTLLPKAYSTTLFFSDRELDWLKGTTLHSATLVRKRRLEGQWRRLEPGCQQLALAEGVERAPTYHDFLWAFSTFWSRAMPLPMPREGGGVETEEGIVPGLDFANHAAGSAAKWTVFGAADMPSKEAPTCVSLICPRQQLPRPGEEVTISYGDKGNEELLFAYGFALRDNPNDVLMVSCPIPPSEEWDEKMLARMRLLMLRQLKPQIFLPAPFLRQQQEEQRAAEGVGRASKRRRWWWPFGRRRAAVVGAGADTAGDLGADLPEEVFDTLELFVIDPKQLQQELARLEEGGSTAEGAPAQARGELSPTERSGRRMAVLATLVRLLEYKVVEQENEEEGTGPLEADRALLEAAEEGGGHKLSNAERHALYYRMGQKQLTRDYLVYARRLLEREMRQLRALTGPENAAV